MKNWILSLHVVAVISWMAGVLYLYRLIIYHVEETEVVVKARFEVMERRLYSYITLPAMVVAAVAGIAMILLDPPYYLHAKWLWAKLFAVVLLIGWTRHAATTVRRLADGRPVRGSRHFRIMNEVPTLLMIAIVILVIVKPF